MKSKWLGFLLILLAFGVTLFCYRMLPEQFPIHWGIDGSVDRYEHKAFGAFLLPVIMLILVPLMLFLPKVDPRKDNYVRFGKTYELITNGILLFLFVFQILALSLSLGWIHNTNYFIPVFLGVLFIFLGNYMPKIKQNYFFGIRTPWAIANEDVWRRTHRFGGKVLVIAGILFIGTILLPTSLQSTVIIIVLCVSLIITYLSSYFFFVKG
ncbi:SdpI family protein [Aneurinibacillus uraniidurans]|uniref:SdpI family protein n=1 Tax=Aneurinibacillus uraniidurans TaxID=2966586 RepID=UPI002349FFB4|nr:SdpI family protein [Aneurinibacillus sp. B1]WCN36606.1 SdpI family protein [Aneurinibacillus sp. B1]